MPMFPSYRDFIRLEAKVDAVFYQLHHLEKIIVSIASDIKDRLDKIEASAKANADATSAFAGVVDGLKAELVTIQTAFDAYKASHPDDQEFTGISERLDAVIASIDADTLAEAAASGTPATPAA